MTRRGIFWAAAALVGIVVAAALTWSASQLADQRIGLASEPLSVTNGLAPAGDRTRDRQTVTRRAPHRQRRAHRARPAPAAQLPTTVYVARAPAPAPVVTAPPVTAPPATTTSTATSQAPSQRDDNAAGSGRGSGSSGGGRQRDD